MADRVLDLIRETSFTSMFVKNCQTHFRFSWLEDHVSPLMKSVLMTVSEILKSRQNKNDEKNGGVTFSKNDYCCLYEYLKGRDIEKIKFKYGEKTFDDMIGHKIEDQFIITAVDLLKQQITTLNNEMRTKKQLIQDKLTADIKSLQLMAQEETSNVTKTYTMQIEDINKQIIDLIKTNAGISI